ncbi:MAG: hypothetical protein JXE06_04075 [Coriobacteriia bacterium]|nr:hypothetical protein [Coriobacteriia bacterium]MBN2822972.1 hypothetical protein [Coriobacteriia bacterium]
MAETDINEPTLRESYSLVYAFTLLLYLPAIILLGTQGYYSYTPGYLALMVLPPLLGMLIAIRIGDLSESWKAVVIRSLVSGVLGMVIGGAVFMTTSFFLAFLGPAFEAHAFDALSIGVGAVFLLLGLPLVLTAVSRFRTRGASAKIEAVACVLALVVVAGVAVMLLDGQHSLVSALRKDQLSYLVGGVLWYTPAYALVGSVWRLIGLV